jgi:hypothetical protein
MALRAGRVRFSHQALDKRPKLPDFRSIYPQSLLVQSYMTAAVEASMRPVVGPGLPPSVKDAAFFVTRDCISVS